MCIVCSIIYRFINDMTITSNHIKYNNIYTIAHIHYVLPYYILYILCVYINTRILLTTLSKVHFAFLYTCI